MPVHVLLAGMLAMRYDPIRVSFIQLSVCALTRLALLFEDIDPDAIRLVPLYRQHRQGPAAVQQEPAGHH